MLKTFKNLRVALSNILFDALLREVPPYNNNLILSLH